jgi:anthranilate phosphoribosyltransferase
VGVGFMMSANYHPAMKIVKPVRKKLKIKTVFNILGPLLNPARVSYAVIGVYHENIVSILYLLEVARNTKGEKQQACSIYTIFKSLT